MNPFSPLLYSVLVLATSAAAAPGRLDVPLTVRDVSGCDRSVEPVSTGVPMPAGLLPAADGIAVFGPNGKPVPAQFRVLERWRERAVGKDDRSIKWLLVTFLAGCPKGGTATYRLRRGRNPAPDRPAGAVGLEGGELKLVLTPPEGKPIAKALAGGRSQEVVEPGPVRRCLRYEKPSLPGGRGFGYIAWVYTYGGKKRIDLTVVLKHAQRKPKGPLYFRDFSVQFSPQQTGKAVRFMLGREPGKALVGELKAGQSAWLYQASDGTDGWASYGGDWRDEIALDWSKKLRGVARSAFRGYRVRVGGEQAGQGDAALGWAARTAGGQTVVLANRWFWQNYPSAVEVDGGGIISRLWPKYTKAYTGLHWLDDLQRKRFDLSLRLVEGKLEPGDADAIALTLNRPLVAHCGLEWYRATGLFGRLGDAKLADAKAPTVGQFPRSFTRGLGWVAFGGDTLDRIKRRYHHNRMDGFIRSGNPWEAYELRAAMDHSCGLNCLHVDDYQYPRDALLLYHGHYCGTVRPAGPYRPGTKHHGYKPWNMAHFEPREVFDGHRLFGDPLARRTVEELAVYCQGYADFREKYPGRLVAGTRADGHPMTNLAECYRILGQADQLACLRRLADVAWKQVDKHRGNYGMMSQWEGGREDVEKPFMMCQVIRGLRDYWELTDDERAADQVLGMLDFIRAEASLGPWGFSYVVKLDPAKQAEYVRKLIHEYEVVRKGKTTSYTHLARAFAWGHWYSGEPRFRKIIDHLNHKAYPHRSRRYVAYYPDRDDKAPPGPVKDLKAEPLGDGRVKLTWTTPHDAATLQIKHASLPMAERCRPDQRGKQNNWWSASHVTGEPAARPGKRQSMIVPGVPAGRRVFAVRTFDSARNRSEMGNQVPVEVK